MQILEDGQICVNQEGTELLVPMGCEEKARVGVYDTHDGNFLRSYGHKELYYPRGLCEHAGEVFVLSGTKEMKFNPTVIFVFESTTGKTLRRLEGLEPHSRGVQLYQGEPLIRAQDSVCVFDPARTGKALRRWGNPTPGYGEVDFAGLAVISHGEV